MTKNYDQKSLQYRNNLWICLFIWFVNIALLKSQLTKSHSTNFESDKLLLEKTQLENVQFVVHPFSPTLHLKSSINLHFKPLTPAIFLFFNLPGLHHTLPHRPKRFIPAHAHFSPNLVTKNHSCRGYLIHHQG